MTAGMESHPDKCGTCGGAGGTASVQCRDCGGRGVNYKPAARVCRLDGERLCSSCGSMPIPDNAKLAAELRETVMHLVELARHPSKDGILYAASNIAAKAEQLEGRCFTCHLKTRTQ